MKKRLMAVLAATAVLGCTTAFAVNPFSDVTPNDWAYQAVEQLAAEGIINGYPDGTFKGQRNITRYEMAQMVAKAIARQNRVDAEQQAIIQRLANEFSAELNTLGVRVGNLEKKVGNVRISGEGTLQYKHNDMVEADKSATMDKTSQYAAVPESSTWTAGAKLHLSAAPNKHVAFGATVKATDLTLEKSADNNGSLYLDELWVGTQVKGFNLLAGRKDVVLGSGLVWDQKVDGVQASMSQNGLGFAVGHGDEMSTDHELTYAQIKGGASGVALTGYYATFHGMHDVYGASLETGFQGVKLMGEWATRNNGNDKDLKGRDAWMAGVGFGNYDISKAGTFGLVAQYFDEGVNSPIMHTTFDQGASANYKGWTLTGNYAVADNLGLTVEYTFAGETKEKMSSTDTHTDYPASYYAKLKYTF